MRRSQVTVQTLAVVYVFAVDGGAVQSYPTKICPPSGAIFNYCTVKFLSASGDAGGTDVDVLQTGVSLIGAPLSAVGLVPAGTVFSYTASPALLVSDGTEITMDILVQPFTQGKLIVEVNFNVDSE